MSSNILIMNCLLIAATPGEIAPFIQWYRSQLPSSGATVDILVSGVGIMATTWAITQQLHLKQPDLILQAGIAGSFDKRAAPGSVWVISSEAIADQGVTENGQLHSLFDMKLVSQNQPPFKKGWLPNPHKDWLKKTGLPAVKAVTVNQVSTQASTIRQYTEKYQPILESMEGAALHYAALQAGIPFVQLRAVSNYVGVRDKKKWKIKESIAILNQTLISFVNRLDD